MTQPAKKKPATRRAPASRKPKEPAIKKPARSQVTFKSKLRDEVPAEPEIFPLNLSSIKDFLLIGAELREPDKIQLSILHAWTWSTVLKYNTAVRKFLKYTYQRGQDPFTLPASQNDIYEFCIWAGRQPDDNGNHKIAAPTLEGYIIGIKGWHRYHDIPYPNVDKARVSLLITAAAKQDSLQPKEPSRQFIELRHMILLANHLTDKTERELAVFDAVCIAFWGMARIDEVSYKSRTDPLDWRHSVFVSDIIFGLDNQTARITIRGAKACGAGKCQYITLAAQDHMLCPVKAALRLVRSLSSPNDPLFGWNNGGTRRRLVASDITTPCSKIWKEEDIKHLSGHSFRIGGTSMRVALGISKEDVCLLGRWTSDAYKLYVREYSKEQLDNCLKDLDSIHRAWEVVN